MNYFEPTDLGAERVAHDDSDQTQCRRLATAPTSLSGTSAQKRPSSGDSLLIRDRAPNVDWLVPSLPWNGSGQFTTALRRYSTMLLFRPHATDPQCRN
jgi:hypothetical protein